MHAFWTAIHVAAWILWLLIFAGAIGVLGFWLYASTRDLVANLRAWRAEERERREAFRRGLRQEIHVSVLEAELHARRPYDWESEIDQEVTQ